MLLIGCDKQGINYIVHFVIYVNGGGILHGSWIIKIKLNTIFKGIGKLSLVMILQKHIVL